jgi:hypothetical protein
MISTTEFSVPSSIQDTEIQPIDVVDVALPSQGRERASDLVQDHLRRERDQIGRVSANVGRMAAGPPSFDLHVAAIGPAQLLQRFNENRIAGSEICIVHTN